MKVRPPLILASQSPRRRKLLKALKIPFRVRPSKLREAAPRGQAPHRYARQLALSKAKAVASEVKTGWVLGADTIVVLKGRIIGKPSGLATAKKMLGSLQGTTHRVITALALVNAATGRTQVQHASSQVTMRNLSSEEINRFAQKHRDKAGSYAVQEKKDSVVVRVRGSYTNVVGLPMELLKKMFRKGI